MASLYLSDIIARTGLDLKRVMLIRHSVNNKEFQMYASVGHIKEYTCHQKANFAKGAEYLLVFISGQSTTAKFYMCYKISGTPILAKDMVIPAGSPHPEWYQRENEYYYPLEETDIMADMKDRLVIEWGKAATVWSQWATNQKEVLGIQMSQKEPFPGFEKLLLSFDKLQEVVGDPDKYEAWHTAMSSVYAIYLIADTEDGMLYVGSASGDRGLLGRWTEYANTGHGGNIKMVKKLVTYPDRCRKYQFSVLQVLSMSLTKNEVDQIESMWKNKVLSRIFGMNDN